MSDLPARPLGPGATAWYAASDVRALLLAVRTLVLQVSHLLGVVPSVLRRSPLALFAMWRTGRDPRIRPEPIRYP